MQTPAEWLEEQFEYQWKHYGEIEETYSYEFEQWVTRYTVVEWNIESHGAFMTVKQDHEYCTECTMQKEVENAVLAQEMRSRENQNSHSA